MNRKEELCGKAALAFNNPFFVELISRAQAARPGGFVGIVKRICEILALEDQVAASVRYAAILARDFPVEFTRACGVVETQGESAMTTPTIETRKPTGLFLRRGQVFCGMTVALALDGKTEPETDPDGNWLLLKLMLGGVPQRVKFYPLDGGIKIHRDETGQVTVVKVQGFEEFRPDVRFMPIDVFSLEEAPPDTDYVVFVDGERLRFPDPRYGAMIIVKSGRGQFAFRGCGSRWGKPYSPPANARLVPITEIGKSHMVA